MTGKNIIFFNVKAYGELPQMLIDVSFICFPMQHIRALLFAIAVAKYNIPQLNLRTPFFSVSRRKKKKMGLPNDRWILNSLVYKLVWHSCDPIIRIFYSPLTWRTVPKEEMRIQTIFDRWNTSRIIKIAVAGAVESCPAFITGRTELER